MTMLVGKSLLVAMLLAALTAVPCWCAATVNATASGCYLFFGGVESPCPPGDYAAGQMDDGVNQFQYRNYFVFDLSKLSGAVTSATLNIVNRQGSFPASSSNASDTYAVYAPSATAAQLIAGEATYDTVVNLDLPYGSVAQDFNLLTDGQTVSIPLDATALGALTSAVGTSQFAIGGQVLDLPSLGNDILFTGSPQPGDVTLVIDGPMSNVPWNLTATFADGGSATGSFVYDASTGTFSNWNVSAMGGDTTTFFPFVFTPDNSSLSHNQNGPGGFTIYFTSNTAFPDPIAPNPETLDLAAELASPLTDGGGLVNIQPGMLGGAPSSECFNCDPYRLITCGTVSTGAATLGVAPASLPTGAVNVTYPSFGLAACGGAAPYTWSLSGGALPIGLSLDSSAGVIRGKPTNAGMFMFTVMVTDSSPLAPQTATQTYTVTINPAAPPAVLSPGQELVAAFTTVPNSADLLFLFDLTPLTTTGSPTITAALYDGSTLLGTYTQTAFTFLQVEFESLASQFTATNIVGPPPTRVDFTNINNGTIAGKMVITVSGGTISFNLGDIIFYDALSVTSNSYQPQSDVKESGSPGIGPATTPMPGIDASQSGITFQTPQGGSSPAPQSFVLTNSTSASLSYTAAVSTLSGGSWLSISGGSGSVAANSVSAPLTVSVNPSGLATGDYYGMIEIDTAGSPNSMEMVTVVLNVLSAGANPGAGVTPTGLVFLAAVNGANPAEQSVALTNVLSRSTMFDAGVSSTSDFPVFSVSPTQGVIEPGQTASVQVTASTAGLPAGIYRGTLTLMFPQDSVTRLVDLLLVVAASGGQNTHSKYTTQQAAACPATQLLLVFSQLGASFGLNASWPTAVQTIVVDDCANVVNNGSVSVTFSNGDPSLPLVATQDGSWDGSWTPLNAVTPAVTLTATATDARGLTGSAQISGNLQPNPQVPILNAGGIVSGASFSAAATPSPGELVSIFGTNLADGMETAHSFPLSTQMQNAFVLIGGEALPLVYVSPTQVNAVVPYDVMSGLRHRAVARHGARLSTPQRFTFALAQPAIFTTQQTGTGQGHIYVIPAGGGQILADSSAPAAGGDVLTIYGTGLGPVTPPVEAGTATPTPPPLTQTVNTVSMTIGGLPATVLFAGLAPGFTGLYQINAIVPSGVAAGDQAPVILSVAGISSPPVTMAVR